MKEIRRSSIYKKWLKKLKDREAIVRINTRVKRLGEGNPGDHRFLGGVSEMRIDYGPGYRVYYKIPEKKLSFCSAAAISPHSKQILKGLKKLS